MSQQGIEYEPCTILTGRLSASFLGGKIREHIIVGPSREGKERRAVANSRAIGVPNVWAAVYVPSLGGACRALEHKQQQLFASSACSGWGGGLFLFGGEMLKNIYPFFFSLDFTMCLIGQSEKQTKHKASNSALDFVKMHRRKTFRFHIKFSWGKVVL